MRKEIDYINLYIYIRLLNNKTTKQLGVAPEYWSPVFLGVNKLVSMLTPKLCHDPSARLAGAAPVRGVRHVRAPSELRRVRESSCRPLDS